MKLSVVSPVYKSRESLPELVERISEACSRLCDELEIVLVDDHSPDESWEVLERLSREDSRVKSMRLSFNVGQDKAITAGLLHTTGDFVVVIDCDLQDDPAHIPRLLEKQAEGYDVVLTLKTSREYPFLKNIFALMFHRTINFMVEDARMHSDPRIGSFSVMSRRAVDTFLKFKDQRRHFLMVVKMMGFQRGYVEVPHNARPSGSSSYSLPKLFRIVIDSWVIYSSKLLRLAAVLSFLQFIVGVGLILYLVVEYFAHGFLNGWASTMSALLLTTGCIQLSLGIIGLYIERIFEEVRGRPLFVVEKSLNI